MGWSALIETQSFFSDESVILYSSRPKSSSKTSSNEHPFEEQVHNFIINNFLNQQSKVETGEKKVISTITTLLINQVQWVLVHLSFIIT